MTRDDATTVWHLFDSTLDCLRGALARLSLEVVDELQLLAQVLEPRRLDHERLVLLQFLAELPS